MEGERRVRCSSLAGGGSGVQDHKRGFRNKGQGELLPARASLEASATCSASFLVSFSLRNWITARFSAAGQPGQPDGPQGGFNPDH